MLKISKSAINLGSLMNRISITPDMTVKERDQDRKLRMELKAKKDSGDNDWYIKNGKLIKKNFQN